MPLLLDQKALLRREAKVARASLDEMGRAKAALALSHALWPLLHARKHETIAVFLARADEISLDPLIEILLEAGCQLCAPRLDLNAQTMSFFRLDSLRDVQIGPWNVREPTSDEPLTPSLVVVPGLAFDANGNRLGRGGGWYDRTLTPQMTAIGACFDCQIVPRVPVESHDRRMNWVFSERRCFGPVETL